MHILALEPYHGGSHRAFLDGWRQHSRHQWTTLGLPPHHWKWRMRHAAITLANDVNRLVAEGERFDLVFGSDMLNLAEFSGMVHPSVTHLPRLIYFHENQLTYPDRGRQERDHHYAVTNFISAVAADAVWFNSEYHRRTYLTAIRDLLGKMPDYTLPEELSEVEQKSVVRYPGIEQPPNDGNDLSGGASRAGNPRDGDSDIDRRRLRIVWAARWEHDKDPDTLLAALQQYSTAGGEFELSLLGESFREIPPALAAIRDEFPDQIKRWGYQPSRHEYWNALAEADVFVSTAIHEFFGISAVEAAAAGAFVLLPCRLAYPEVFQLTEIPERARHFHDGTPGDLANMLLEIRNRKRNGTLWPDDVPTLAADMQRFHWESLASKYDDDLEQITADARR